VLGFDVKDRELMVNKGEAETVRTIFQVYLEHGGLIAAVAELHRRGIKNKTWTTKAGKVVRGTSFTKNTLRALLTNPLYVGKVRCANELVDGRHDAIIDAGTFDAAAKSLKLSRRPGTRGPGRWGSILAGILRCGRCGSAMTSSVNIRGTRIHRYYVCARIHKEGAAACQGSRAPAGELEESVVARIRSIGTDPSVLTATLTAARQARAVQEPELAAETRRLANERGQITGQRTNLLDALQHGGVATATIVSRLADVDEQLARLLQRQREVTAQLAAITNDTVDEDVIHAALTNFTGTWDELVPRERARVLRLLIAEVRFDAQAGELTIEFRDNGIRALARDSGARRTA
jgi:site-specific DNA recombinase